MKIKSKFVLFDYDGTIVNSETAILTGIKYALEFYGYEAPSDNILRTNIGKPLLPVFADLTNNSDTKVHSNLLETYRNWYYKASEKDLINDYLYPDARKIIMALASDGYILGIATNKSRTGLLEGLKRHKLLEFFTTIKTVHDTKPKPDPEMGLISISEAGVSKSNTVMVGDTISDALMSKNCSIKFIGVNWGFNDAETLSNNGALSVVNSYDELYKKIKIVLPN
jgi:phosphoglycolate phosphatase